MTSPVFSVWPVCARHRELPLLKADIFGIFKPAPRPHRHGCLIESFLPEAVGFPCLVVAAKSRFTVGRNVIHAAHVYAR